MLLTKMGNTGLVGHVDFIGRGTYHYLARTENEGPRPGSDQASLAFHRQRRIVGS